MGSCKEHENDDKQHLTNCCREEPDFKYGSIPEVQKPIDVNVVMDDSENSARFNTGKLKWSYVGFKALAPMVRVLEYGALKYAPMNWQKPPKDKMEHLESMMRHLTALIEGEALDPESELHHIGHIMCNAMFYSYHECDGYNYDSSDFEFTSPYLKKALEEKAKRDEG